MTDQLAAAVIDVPVDAVAAAVRACPAVDDLHVDPLRGGVTTYLPGRRIEGLRIGETAITVAVRGRWGVPVVEVAQQIRRAVSPLGHGRRIDVVLTDLTAAPGYELVPPRPEPLVPAVSTVDPQESRDQWMTPNVVAAGGPSSAPIIPTEGETLRSSSPG